MTDSEAQDFPLPYASTDLSGQVALVTGASSGLGRRFAQTLAAAGARVVVTGRRGDRLKEVADEIVSTGGQCEPFTMDVTDATDCVSALDHAESAFGTVTILVNNAGIPDAQRAHKMSLEAIDAVIATNVRGPFVLSCEVARRLIAAGLPGRIVNLSSMAAFNYTGNGAALYSSTKAAVNRMTEALAVEWVRYGINVNAISPGSFASEMHDGMVARVGDFSQRLPRKRFGEPAQLDSTLLFLVGPSSEVVTGTVIKADDGQFPR
ncbi:short-chain dehydrogenase/reductase [Mycolicibacterium chitae]|uniref:2-deoxy-D-gluconate 3-dehydrogenase n=1 Tax=Mycolicibacterium chitae TaxID=1792 RepID=A0A448I9Z1_MYCCI|nr:SDR family NAD(P)-dependent oxidoreductase [Mycolicibacterium chitae]MCV7105093.1 SDR family NAD(P)-dependent oxidoreductase [Mycolicibacterium chitae]BBZ05626.1 short-chain dehydrogenase/reductase [Mycolicibacterium chitae]VEG49238.1 2-deoxy-D-gluconate 3-dehydrogenase [Mycolicibacterium chitae]